MTSYFPVKKSANTFKAHCFSLQKMKECAYTIEPNILPKVLSIQLGRAHYHPVSHSIISKIVEIRVSGCEVDKSSSHFLCRVLSKIPEEE